MSRTTKVDPSKARKEQAPRAEGSPTPRNPCPISYSHLPHDYCDGKPTSPAIGSPTSGERREQSCPFCGGLGVLLETSDFPSRKKVWIQCNECGAQSPRFPYYDKDKLGTDEAWEAWRKRITQPQRSEQPKRVGPPSLLSDEIEAEKRNSSPRGQQQEWTLRENQFDWSIMSGELAIASVENKPSGLGICKAHNAELAAERQEHNKAWNILHAARTDHAPPVSLVEHAQKIVAELAAERNETRIMTNQCVQLHQELAAERQRNPPYETVLEALGILTKAYDEKGKPNTLVALATVAAAERQRNKRDGKWLDEMGACKVCDGEIPQGHTDNCDIWKLEQQLAAERQLSIDAAGRWAKALAENYRLKKQLLSALAAIEEIKNWLDEQANKVRGKFLPLAQTEKLDERLAVFIETATFIHQLNVDLSALHEHDEKVRDKERKYWQNILTDAFVQLTKAREVREPLVATIEQLKREIANPRD